ncbi:tetratricopeptide repeat-containing glycosyltransferase family 2 protein [Alloiococcus sp. CFN-8]|uniref:tetratricopeptide repeat-containing glycosyltransferase family 2 protein n=1 Tax=Alloiococcus sp. CFN-8 TaxID=3416081 RepID=UPI003CFA5261
MNNSISLCMIVKNEEEYLPQCLESAQGIVEEIILVDTGSTDRTVEIAETFGAKVYHYPWNNNFSEARNFSLEKATKNWIFILDGDDVIFPEDQKILKSFLEKPLSKDYIYNFETLSYHGDTPDENNVTINLNPRLFPNHLGIHYEGEVHNQLIYPENMQNIIFSSTKVHHYGYLDKVIKGKNKSNRTMNLILEQLKNDPQNPFANFNLGTEYSNLNKNKDALDCFYKAFDSFQPDLGYSYILILRIIILNYREKNYENALRFIEIGLKHYPKAADIHFYKALIYKTLAMPLSQLDALEKALEIGESPSPLKFFYGTGTFKAACEIGTLLISLKEYDKAYSFLVKALQYNPRFYNPLYDIAHILTIKKTSIKEMKDILEGFISSDPNRFHILGEVFYTEGFYEAALEYIDLQEKLSGINEKLLDLRLSALLRSGSFEECIALEGINENSPEKSNIILKLNQALALVILREYDSAKNLLSHCSSFSPSATEQKQIKVYESLIALLTDEATEDISTIKEEEDYLNIIIDILSILLMNQLYDIFEAAVKLLTLIDNKNILLALGKLYHSLGYTDYAKTEIKRSIQLFDCYDREGLEILMK